MKKIYLTLIIAFVSLFSPTTRGQHSPLWIQNLNSLPDSAYLFPVKTATDLNNNVFALSTFYEYVGTTFDNKIILNKFDSNGNLLWNLDFDNGGIGKPRGFDMVIDHSGNCYIMGGLMDYPNYKPFLMKVSDTGSVLWTRDSTTAFNTTTFEQMILKNDLLYLRSALGVSLFDNNGNELWSVPISTYSMGVDNNGKMLVSSFPSPRNTLHRFDLSGSMDFSDSTIVADRIAFDYHDNIYLLAQWPNYELAKLDSNGAFQWWRNDFPYNLSFGDQGFELLVDFNNDVLLVGLSDTMYKHRPDGSRIWWRPMNGLDAYIIDAQISTTNHLLVAGSPQGIVPGGIRVEMFDLNGNSAWAGVHQSNIQQEFIVSMAISSDGIYVLEDSISSSSLIKFESPLNNTNLDFDLICIDSVWYDPADQQFVYIRVYNGNISGINYPSVQMISPAGDTVSNPSNSVDFFVHPGNFFLEYRDTILDPNITDFSSYSFLFSEGFRDTTVAVGWCSRVGIEKITSISAIVYPNPVKDLLNIQFEKNCNDCRLELFSIEGRKIIDSEIHGQSTLSINMESIQKGFYFLNIRSPEGLFTTRIIKH
jgi:hypothetical protein